jgi:hypothetical protein
MIFAMPQTLCFAQALLQSTGSRLLDGSAGTRTIQQVSQRCTANDPVDRRKPGRDRRYGEVDQPSFGTRFSSLTLSKKFPDRISRSPSKPKPAFHRIRLYLRSRFCGLPACAPAGRCGCVSKNVQSALGWHCDCCGAFRLKVTRVGIARAIACWPRLLIPNEQRCA